MYTTCTLDIYTTTTTPAEMMGVRLLFRPLGVLLTTYYLLLTTYYLLLEMMGARLLFRPSGGRRGSVFCIKGQFQIAEESCAVNERCAIEEIMYMQCAWSVHVVYMWCTCGVHVVYMSCACRVHVVYM